MTQIILIYTSYIPSVRYRFLTGHYSPNSSGTIDQSIPIRNPKSLVFIGLR